MSNMNTVISIIPASTQAGRETIRTILASDTPYSIRAFYRDPSKAPAEFTADKRFTAVQGDVGKGEGLDFSGSRSVLYIPPPTYDGSDTVEFGTRAAKNIKSALESTAGLERLVLHSAVGTHNESGIGILALNHVTDKILKDAAPSVVIPKPGYYIETWASALQAIKSDPPTVEVFSSPEDHAFAMVSVRDVAEFFAKHLLEDVSSSGCQSIKVFGPRLYSARDIMNAVERATGKKGDLKCVEPDKLEEFFGPHVPEKYIGQLAEMIRALLPGGVLVKEFEYDEGTYVGRFGMEDVLEELEGGDAKSRGW